MKIREVQVKKAIFVKSLFFILNKIEVLFKFVTLMPATDRDQNQQIRAFVTFRMHT